MDAFVAWLDQMGKVVFLGATAMLVILDLAAVAAVAITQDRRLVNRWTARVLGANLVLLGAGLGAPLAAFTVRTVVGVLRPFVPATGHATIGDEAPGAKR
ncbi:MAG: hypothetical protein HY275_09035 [Gemmatimonadetes bacterium]|nr:hypothetical protein [Gemmatimonadota bacterium]